MNSSLWKLNLGDFERGLIVAFLSAFIGALYEGFTGDGFSLEWAKLAPLLQASAKFGIIGILAYLVKNISTNSENKVLKSEPKEGNKMKKRRFGIFPVVLIIMFLVAGLQGCSGTLSSLVPPPDALKNPFVKSSYKVLFSMAQAYNAAWKSFKDLNEVGVVTDATFLKGKELARQYVKANKEAVNILIAVEKGTSGQVEAQALITSVQIANDAIMAFLKPYLASQIKT